MWWRWGGAGCVESGREGASAEGERRRVCLVWGDVTFFKSISRDDDDVESIILEARVLKETIKGY